MALILRMVPTPTKREIEYLKQEMVIMLVGTINRHATVDFKRECGICVPYDHAMTYNQN